MLYKKLFLLITNILYHTNMNKTSKNSKFGKKFAIFSMSSDYEKNITIQFKNGI